jgi:hypothetical protein
MAKYYKFSVGFYLIVLGLATPFYLILYGASGHEFHFNMEDWIWILTAVCTFTLTVIYLFNKDKEGFQYQILKAGLGILMLTTLYGGLQSFKYILNFKFGSDISIIVVGLSYIIPLIFIGSNYVILLELLRELRMKMVSAANHKK